MAKVFGSVDGQLLGVFYRVGLVRGWEEKDLEKVILKVRRIGVSTVDDLLIMIRSDALQARLKQVGERAFTKATLDEIVRMLGFGQAARQPGVDGMIHVGGGLRPPQTRSRGVSAAEEFLNIERHTPQQEVTCLDVPGIYHPSPAGAGAGVATPARPASVEPPPLCPRPPDAGNGGARGRQCPSRTSGVASPTPAPPVPTGAGATPQGAPSGAGGPIASRAMLNAFLRGGTVSIGGEGGGGGTTATPPGGTTRATTAGDDDDDGSGGAGADAVTAFEGAPVFQQDPPGPATDTPETNTLRDAHLISMISQRAEYFVVRVPLNWLFFFQFTVAGCFTDGVSLQQTVDELRAGRASPYTLPLMHCLVVNGRLYGMGTRRLLCYHYLWGQTHPNMLIPVLFNGYCSAAGNHNPSGMTMHVIGSMVLDGRMHMQFSRAPFAKANAPQPSARRLLRAYHLQRRGDLRADSQIYYNATCAPAAAEATGSDDEGAGEEEEGGTNPTPDTHKKAGGG